MTSIREMVRRLLGKVEDQPEAAGPPSPQFSYRVYWMKTARAWGPERLERVEAALRRVVDEEGFEANLFQRRYRIEELDEQAHAGASLLALLEVIEALRDYETEAEEEHSDDQ